MKYLVEMYDKEQNVTFEQKEFDTIKEATKEYSIECNMFMENSDANNTIIILSQVDENGLYESIEEYDRGSDK